MIQVTDKAKNYLLEATTNSDKPFVRFSVKGGGCSDSNTNGIF